MQKLSMKWIVVLASVLVFGVSSAYADKAVMISSPEDGATVSSPVKVCMEVKGVEVEPAKNGVHEGKGHHHLLINTDLPSDLGKPIGKDDQHVHMGDGSTCKELTLSAGEHTIQALFAKGDHVPYSPAITSKITITVK